MRLVVEIPNLLGVLMKRRAMMLLSVMSVQCPSWTFTLKVAVLTLRLSVWVKVLPLLVSTRTLLGVPRSLV